MALLICSGLLNPTGWAAQPFKDTSQLFFRRAEKPSKDTAYNFDEYERVKKGKVIWTFLGNLVCFRWFQFHLEILRQGSCTFLKSAIQLFSFETLCKQFREKNFTSYKGVALF
jgi:hypothetical protein